MTRARRTGGRIIFVGAGPGDPGLLTVRSVEALAGAALLVTDPDVPAAVVALAINAEVHPAVGEATEVAKVLVVAAKAGQAVVRLVAGDVLTVDLVVKELQAVARTTMPFDIVPGISAASAAASYAGVAVGSVHTIADVRSTSDWSRLAAAPGTLLLQASEAISRILRPRSPTPALLQKRRRRSPRAPRCPPSGPSTAPWPDWTGWVAISPDLWWWPSARALPVGNGCPGGNRARCTAGGC